MHINRLFYKILKKHSVKYCFLQTLDIQIHGIHMNSPTDISFLCYIKNLQFQWIISKKKTQQDEFFEHINFLKICSNNFKIQDKNAFANPGTVCFALFVGKALVKVVLTINSIKVFTHQCQVFILIFPLSSFSLYPSLYI